MKYKNAQIKNLLNRGWYISLGDSNYLSKSGETINWFTSDCSIKKTDPLIMHETREQAQATLDKYSGEPTVSVIKEELSAYLKDNLQIAIRENWTNSLSKVLEVSLILEGSVISKDWILSSDLKQD